MKIRFILAYIFVCAIYPFTVLAQAKNLRSEIARIADTLGKEQGIHFGRPVGIGGRRETDNKYYLLYLQLKEKATDEELVQLSGDSSKSLVVYSFDILFKRQYRDLTAIFLQHINDSTNFWIAEGCINTEDRINWYMLRLLDPSIKNRRTKYMTKDEFDGYCNRFKLADDSFY